MTERPATLRGIRGGVCVVGAACALLGPVAGSQAHAAAPAAANRAGVARDTSADVAAIRAETRRWIDAFRAHDIDALMALYMPDAQVALHGQKKLVGRDAIRAFFAPALAARPEVTFELEIEDIRVDGELAYLLSKYWYVSRARDGTVLRDAGRSLIVYHRDPADRGRWKLQVDIDQATPDVAFPPGR